MVWAALSLEKYRPRSTLQGQITRAQRRMSRKTRDELVNGYDGFESRCRSRSQVPNYLTFFNSDLSGGTNKRLLSEPHPLRYTQTLL